MIPLTDLLVKKIRLASTTLAYNWAWTAGYFTSSLRVRVVDDTELLHVGRINNQTKEIEIDRKWLKQNGCNFEFLFLMLLFLYASASNSDKDPIKNDVVALDIMKNEGIDIKKTYLLYLAMLNNNPSAFNEQRFSNFRTYI